MITLVKNNCFGLTTQEHPEYKIMFKGSVWGKLYYNMTGYVADNGLPCMYYDRIVSLNIGEKSLSSFRKEISRLNREFK